jgi:kumamolisin
MTSIRLGLFALAAVATGAFAASTRPAVGGNGGAAWFQAKGTDLGKLSTLSSETVTATVALKLRNADQLEGLAAALYNSGTPSYHKFLTADAFRARFAPTADTVSKVTASLQKQGLGVELVNGTLLRVTGSTAAMQQAFGVELHSYLADDGGTFHAPTGFAQLSPDISGSVHAVLGLDTHARFHPNHHHASATAPGRGSNDKNKAPNTPDVPGLWTVTDFADYYDVNPLYQRGITGKGTTIGIVTLAAFTPSDAFAYWASLGLAVDPNRITVVNVDNPPKPSDRSGSEETTLDVEQSGGIAPGAKIIVYVAPNTDQGFLDAWSKAVNDNTADTISTSWGEWEEFVAQGNPASDPDAAGEIQAYHNLFIQAAIQGQSIFAAAGDAGSFDTSGELPAGFNDILSVDHPASDSFICAAGGTTLPGTQTFAISATQNLSIEVKKERAWSWDYLTPLCDALGLDPVSCGIFPVGGGGGVSVVFPVPFYQDGIEGIRTSEPGQTLIDSTQTPPQTVLTLPAHFHGRNLPDVSLNADPETGYIIFYTSSRTKTLGVDEFVGGTSFVAPQLAGVSALINQNAHGRVGLLNFPLYELQFTGKAYNGKSPPLRDIRDGNNEFYQAGNNYDLASGTGVLDVTNFADLFR